ncbi:MAG: F0F1 ATP synthase subunit B [Gammaproteobacteria bacterium]
MSINVTLVVQMFVFALFVWFTMSYLWPMIRQAMEEREQRIADGLAAAEQGQGNLLKAEARAGEIVEEARGKARDIVDQANSQASGIVSGAREEGEQERQRRLESAQTEIEVEINRARDELRGQVAMIAMAGAQKVLEREIDSETHRDLLDRLASEI